MMKRGAKRPALSSDSGSNPKPFDSSLRSKRVMDAPSFDVDRAESSCQHLMEVKSLDAKRAESSRQHVRALNAQFASWVQLQLQNHPDELWEDGVKDYLSHTSHILEKFKDVVDWLRANSSKAGAATPMGLPSNSSSAAELQNSAPPAKSEPYNGFTRENKSASLQSSGLSNSHSFSPFSSDQLSASSSGLLNSTLSGSHNSVFSLSQKPASSSLHSSGLSGSQTTGFFNISQSSASSSLPSSGLSGSQTTGFFNISQSPASSSLQSSGLSTSQASGLFAFGQPPDSTSLQNSGSSGSQSSGWFTSSQTVSASGLHSSGLSNSQGAGFFGFSSPAGSSLQSSQIPGFFAIKQPQVSYGSQSFTSQKSEASADADEENELEQPSSPSLKKIEEKGVVIVHKVKCKVYVKPDNPEDKGWKDMGVGELSIKCKEGVEKTAKESKPTIIVRNDVGKILLNALIYPAIKMNIKKNTITSIFHTSGADGDKAVARTYLLRLKSEEETTTLASTIQDYAPSA